MYTLVEHQQTCSSKKQTKMLDDIKSQYEHKITSLQQQLQTQEKYYQAIISEKDKQLFETKEQLFETKEQLEKRIDDITDIARQTKTKTTNTNITINNTSLDLQDTSHIRSILDQYMDINVLALGQKGVARMLKDTLLTDEYGQKRYRCTDANRGNFEYIDPDGNLQRDPKAAKLTTALVQSEIRDLAYDRGDKFWKNEDGSTDMRKFDTMSEKVQEVATIQQDDTKFRTELSKLMS